MLCCQAEVSLLLIFLSFLPDIKVCINSLIHGKYRTGDYPALSFIFNGTAWAFLKVPLLEDIDPEILNRFEERDTQKIGSTDIATK